MKEDKLRLMIENFRKVEWTVSLDKNDTDEKIEHRLNRLLQQIKQYARDEWVPKERKLTEQIRGNWEKSLSTGVDRATDLGYNQAISKMREEIEKEGA